MSNTLIYINGELVDLYPGTIVATTFKAFEIGDLTSRNSTYTNQFRLPKTETNKRIFGFADNIKSGTTFPYTRYTGKIVQNGIEVLAGAAVRLTESNEYFNIEFFSGAFNFFDLLGERTLSDLWQDKAPQLTDWPLANSLLEPVFFNTGALDESDNPLSFDGKLCIKYMDVLKKIIEDNGYSATGNVLSNETLESLYFLAFGFQDKYNDKFPKLRECHAERDTSVPFVATDSNLKIAFTKVIHNGGFYDGNSTFQVSDELYGGTFFLCNAYAVLVIDSIVFAGGATRLRVQLSSGSGTYTIPDITGPGTYLLELSDNVVQDPLGSPVTFISGIDGLEVFVQARTTDSIGNPTGSATVTFAQGTSFRIECLKDIPLPGLYRYVSGVLPDLSQKDFFRDFAIRTGTLFRERGGILECKTISEIIADRANAVDWTSKRDTTRPDKVVYEFRNYAQNNYFRYQSTDDLTSDETGEGNIEIENQNLEDEREVYTSPFSSSHTRPHGNANAGFVIAADIPIVEDGADENDPGLRLLMVRARRASEPILSGSISNYKVGYFLDVDGIEGKDASFQHALSEHYVSLTEFLQKAKVVTRYYNLTVIDIAALDLFKLVYDDGAYFLINTVENFVPGQLTKVELFKVS